MPEVLIVKIKAGTIVKTVVVATLTYSLMNVIAKQLISPLDKALKHVNDLKEKLEDERAAGTQD